MVYVNFVFGRIRCEARTVFLFILNAMRYLTFALSISSFFTFFL